MKLYNSASRKIEEFIPKNPNEVTFYTCGPTVYHYAHIGNLRSYIMHDILEKSLVYLGYNVKRAMNITDVGHLSGDSDDGEDKMLASAQKQNKSVMEIASFYTQEFKKDTQKLNLNWPKIVVPATSMVHKYIELIEELQKKGFAYKSGENIYFDTQKLDNYYVFGNQSKEDMIIGARDDVDDDTNKRNPADFVLWFTKSKFSNHALSWDSPWGRGYPGWHIECSAIALDKLGSHLDIHAGGVDNKFPHHTNEIAQSEGVLGHSWCSYWFHVEHLNDKSGKMSKSKGDFLTLDRISKDGFSPMMYKYFCLSSHYRKQLVYSPESMNGAKTAYIKLIQRLSKLNPDSGELDKGAFEKFTNQFKSALENDLNTSLAISCIYDVLKSDTNDKTKATIISSIDSVLDLELNKAIDKTHSLLVNDESEVDGEFTKRILALIDERKEAKKQKNFARADEIRNDLLKEGVELIDTREGTTFKIIK